jgi:fatty acid desaturase
LPDFHLNLYDDQESYRQVSPTVATLSPVTVWGLGFVGLGILITILRAAGVFLPTWTGWLAIACFILGVSLSLWHLTRHAPTEFDDEGTV